MFFEFFGGIAMNKLQQLYRKTGWHTVFSFDDEGTSARTNLLFATITQAIVGGFSGGTFYTGLLMGYGINIVNISIITFIPYIASLFTLLTPYVLGRFPRRRVILSVARIAYYAINILGITFLPQLVQDPDARVVGLIIIVFVSNSINFLFAGYSPWHMPHITPEVRTAYFSGTSLVSNLSSSTVLIVASIITDDLAPAAQLRLIVVMRYVAFAIALLDVYFMQKPREPEYRDSTGRRSLLDIFRLPFSNRRFFLTMMIHTLYVYAANISASVTNVWLLQEVNTGYLYINIINFSYSLFVLFTSPIASRIMQKKGTFQSLAVALVITGVSNCIYAFVDHSNFLWLMTGVRLLQHGIGMLMSFSVNNLAYINIPRNDQITYTSCYNFTSNAAVFLGMMTGTGIVAAMGDSHLSVLGHSISGAPLTLMANGGSMLLLAVAVILMRRYVEPEGRKI